MCLLFLSFLNVQQPTINKKKNMTKQQEIVMIIVNKRTNVLNKKKEKKTNKHICCLPIGTNKKDNCQDDL